MKSETFLTCEISRQAQVRPEQQSAFVHAKLKKKVMLKAIRKNVFNQVHFIPDNPISLF